MKFGIIFELSVPRPFDEGVEKMVFDNSLEQARLADELGFESAWCVEHHFLEEYSHSSCPEMFLSACAATTKDIRLGFGIATCVPALNHAVRLAERGAFLDVLSGGRVEFGTGRSSTWTELGGFGASIDDTKRSWDEYVRAFPKMWTQERFSHEGKSFSMPERAVLPKPVQKPHPPMWVAVTAPGTEIEAAERGMGCLLLSVGNVAKNKPRFDKYRETIKNCKPVGHSVNDRIAVMNWLYCDEDQDEAVKYGDIFINTFSSMAAQAIEISQACPSDSYKAIGLLGNLRTDPDDGQMRKKVPGGLCVGTPEDIIATVQEWKDAGADQIIFMVNAREVLEQDKVLKSMRLFAEKVMPHFQEDDNVVEYPARAAG